MGRLNSPTSQPRNASFQTEVEEKVHYKIHKIAWEFNWEIFRGFSFCGI